MEPDLITLNPLVYLSLLGVPDLDYVGSVPALCIHFDRHRLEDLPTSTNLLWSTLESFDLLGHLGV